jgi:hypothetical protein
MQGMKPSGPTAFGQGAEGHETLTEFGMERRAVVFLGHEGGIGHAA